MTRVQGEALYTEDAVRTVVVAAEERLFAPWREGRPETWRPSTQTKDMVCVGFWLREELTRLGFSDDDRKIQEAKFHRWSRSRLDVFLLAAELLNEALEGEIERDRKPHRRWG